MRNIGLTALFILLSCDPYAPFTKDKIINTSPDAVLIKSITPPYGGNCGINRVVLRGQNLSPDPGVTQVFFGGTPAEVLEVAADRILAVAPNSSKDAPEKVQVVVKQNDQIIDNETPEPLFYFSRNTVLDFKPPIRVTVGGTQLVDGVNFPRTLAVGNFAGESTPDLAWVVGERVHILEATSIASYTTDGTAFNGIAKPLSPTIQMTSLAAGDLSGSGFAALVATSQTKELLVMHSDGKTIFAIDYLATGSEPTSDEVGDVDKLGLNDIFYTNSDSNIHLFRNNINIKGRFDTSQQEDLPTGKNLPVAVAYDQISKTGYAVTSTFDAPFTLGIFDIRNSLSGYIAQSLRTISTQSRANPNSLAAGDLDADGEPDFVVTHAVSGGAGGFAGITLYLSGAVGKRVIGVPVPSGLSQAVLADMNGDGLPDVVAETLGERPLVMVNEGSGAFSCFDYNVHRERGDWSGLGALAVVRDPGNHRDGVIVAAYGQAEVRVFWAR